MIYANGCDSTASIVVIVMTPCPFGKNPLNLIKENDVKYVIFEVSKRVRKIMASDYVCCME
jgi:hypothetical protein